MIRTFDLAQNLLSTWKKKSPPAAHDMISRKMMFLKETNPLPSKSPVSATTTVIDLSCSRALNLVLLHCGSPIFVSLDSLNYFFFLQKIYNQLRCLLVRRLISKCCTMSNGDAAGSDDLAPYANRALEPIKSRSFFH